MGHLTYLTFELVWAVPVLIVQWAAGWRALWSRRKSIALAIALPTAYLAGADAVAIANGIWSFHHDRITGLILGNVPIEEVFFFLLTNAMIVQSVALVGSWRTRP